MHVFQKTFELPSYPRGYHLVTNIVKSEMQQSSIMTGVAHIFIHHTSASLTINENADSTVRKDFESHFNQLVPENASYYQHNYEGPDDMPAHLKSSILGCSLNIPVQEGQLLLGTWQGIYLGEHRVKANPRKITVTIMGI